MLFPTSNSPLDIHLETFYILLIFIYKIEENLEKYNSDFLYLSGEFFSPMAACKSISFLKDVTNFKFTF